MIFATIIDREGRENVSQGDPWTIFAGTWSQANGKWFVSYARIYRDIEHVDRDGGPIVDKPIRNEPLKFERGRIEFEGLVFIQDAKLEKSLSATFSDPPSLPSTPGQP